MGRLNYFISSLLGFVPAFFIMNTIGAGLNTYIKEAEIFNIFDLLLSSEIYLPILMFLGLMIASLVIKKKFFDGRN